MLEGFISDTDGFILKVFTRKEPLHQAHVLLPRKVEISLQFERNFKILKKEMSV